MKKISLLFLFSILAFTGYSQVTLGLRVSPAFSINRVKDLNSADGYEFSNNGSGVRFAFGPTIDFKFGDNYAFSTGAWYLSSRAGLSATAPGVSYKEVVSLQSMQIPITFKAYTNEIATNMKLYFQLGGLATFNFYEKFKESSPSTPSSYDNKYSVFDISLYMGAGVSYKIGESNALFGGFYYNRGLVNLLDGSSIPGTSNKWKDAAKYNNDLVGLEVGVTF
ncbi:porin family protein [Cytophaga aurantiaca]|uniref:porin family protein n=1 Tax=Cytophaga aurantiaca TaxID=29530 RepID=UPI00037A7890|nr:porin family protein [Cytophaga aurantiaca]